MRAALSKKGMTLVEFIVGLLLFAIITTVVSAVFTPIFRVQLRARELAECNALLDNIANQMINDLSEASVSLEESNPGLPAENSLFISVNKPLDVRYFTESDENAERYGVLLRIVNTGASEIETPVLPDGAFRRRQIWFTCEAAYADEETKGTAYVLEVTVTSERVRENISRKYAVMPLLLNQNTG